MLLISEAEVEALLDLDQLVDSVGAALSELSAGTAVLPMRATATGAQPNSYLHAMPAHLPRGGALLTKLVSVFPNNRDRPTHQAVICLFDPSNGTPVALMDGTYITAARTAASSALATKLLSHDDSPVITVIGTGVQADAHVRALVRLRPQSRVVVAGRSVERARSLAGRLGEELGRTVDASDSVEEAVRVADVVCAVTHADKPVLRREWLKPGAHVNSVGHNPDGQGEVDTETIRDALVVVESRSAALAPLPSGAADLLQAVEQGVLTSQRVVELGELVNGFIPANRDQDGISLYRSVGVAVEDAAAASLVLSQAIQHGVGVELAL